MNSELRSIRRTNLREEAIAVLRAAILGGELAPGSIHSAVSLAARLGVSPTPVREAMRALVGSGLVEVLPNRGFRVTEISEQDRDEICALRLMLEVPALSLLIERASDASLHEVEQRLSALEAAAAAGDVAAFLAADRAFHLELLSLAGNRRLVRIVAELRDQTRIVRPQTLIDAAAEQRQLLDAIRGRDAGAAQRRLTTQIRRARSDERAQGPGMGPALPRG